MRLNIKTMILATLISFFCAAPVQTYFANPVSIEYRDIYFLILNDKKDLVLEINGEKLIRHESFEETYYYSDGFDSFMDDILKVRYDGKEFDVDLNNEKYIKLYTLDVNTLTITQGKLLSFMIHEMIMRLIITLLLEGAVFFLLGFRKARTYVIFIIVNIITQGLLNFGLLRIPFYDVYSQLFILLFGEIVIFILESVVFAISVKEKRISRIVVCTIAANIVSLIFGSAMMAMMR